MDTDDEQSDGITSLFDSRGLWMEIGSRGMFLVAYDVNISAFGFESASNATKRPKNSFGFIVLGSFEVLGDVYEQWPLNPSFPNQG